MPTTYKLVDGRSVTVRTACRDDASLVQEMHHLLSPRTRRLRYHAYTAELPLEQAMTMCEYDATRQVSLVASFQNGDRECIVGHALLARASSKTVEAETAIVIRDDFQGLGLGSHMLAVLLSACRSQGIKRIFGWVMSQNRHMLRLYRKTKYPVQVQHHSGEMLVTLVLSPPR